MIDLESSSIKSTLKILAKKYPQKKLNLKFSNFDTNRTIRTKKKYQKFFDTKIH